MKVCSLSIPPQTPIRLHPARDDPTVIMLFAPLRRSQDGPNYWMIWEKRVLFEYSSSSSQPKESELALEGESFERTDLLLHFLWTHCFVSKSVSMAKLRLQESPLPPAAPPTHTYICIHTSSSAVCSHQGSFPKRLSSEFYWLSSKKALVCASAVILRLMSFCCWCCHYFCSNWENN